MIERMKWKHLTDEQLSALARELDDLAADMRPDRASIREENEGFDVYAGMKCVARRLRREARRRARRSIEGEIATDASR